MNPCDVVLAISILQVGVDAPRLGLMLVVGQPKNTAEYIQATSRVGQDANRLGLVITLGDWARPCDLAYCEQSRHFHETLHTRVEPLTVTPFSATAIDHGLDGVLVVAARVTQAGCSGGLNPEHNAGCVTEQVEVLERLVDKLSIRISAAAGEEESKYVWDRLTSRVGEWKKHQREVTKKSGDFVYKRGVGDVRHFPFLRLAESASRGGSRPDDGPLVVASPMREVQPEINPLVPSNPARLVDDSTDGAPAWKRRGPCEDRDTSNARTDQEER